MTFTKKKLIQAMGLLMPLAAWQPSAQAGIVGIIYTGAVQTWTAPDTGIYDITA